MERLREQDLRALLDFLRGSYALRDHPAFITHLLSALPTVIPTVVSSYNEMDPGRRTSKNWFWPKEASSSARDRLWEQHMHEHPVLAHFQRTGDGRAFKISDFLTRRQFRDLGLYQEVYRSMGVEDVMAMTFEPFDMVRGLALHRDRRAFTERERLLLNLLRPHLIQAYANAEAVTCLHGELAALQQAVEALEGGVIILSLEGRIQQATHQARQWLAAYFGRCPPSRLPNPLLRWVCHQEAGLRHDDAPPPREPLVVERDGRRLVVRLLSEPTQRLLLLEEQRTTYESSELEALGLSPREAEILSWVAQGKTNPEVALILDLSPRTVGKHLERIFPKLGVETRTAAAARALECLRRPAPAAG